MKFLVLSDTHGKLGPAREVYNSLEGIDRIIHLGDYQRDGKQLEMILRVPVISLKGNMDGSYANEDYRILETEFGKIYLTHGHMEAVKFGTEKLLYKASSLGCGAALFGHTHVPFFAEIDGMYLLNPGSLTNPRGGRNGSYAVVTLEKGRFDASVLYVPDGPAAAEKSQTGSAKKNTGGGFLRSRFNDSDGQ